MKGVGGKLASRIAIIYAICGLVWIVASDRLLAFLLPDAGQLSIAQTYKGWFFILATGLLLFFLLRREQQTQANLLQNYQDIFENAVEGIFQSRPDGRFIRVNPVLAHLYGYDSPEEMVRAVNDIRRQLYVNPLRRDQFMFELLEKNSVEGFESEEYRRDGTTFWTSMNARLVRNGKGTPLFFEGFVTDITRRKLAEEFLREAQIRYRTVVEQVPAAIYTEGVDDDPPGGIYVSPQIETISGYKPEEWTKNRKLWSSIVHPDDIQHYRDENERTGRTGEPFDIEYRVLARDGRTVWVRDMARLIRDETGKPLYWQGIVFDITEQNLTVRALSQSEERYRILVEQASDGIFISDLDGNYIEVNSAGCSMLGYSRGEILRINTRDLLAEGEIDTRPLQPPDPGSTNTVVTIRKLKRKNGTTLSVEISSKILPDGRILSIFRDITQRIEAEEVRLREQKRFQTLLENSMDVIALYASDGTILYQSPAVHKLLGYAPRELEGKNFLNLIHPDDLNLARQGLQTLLKHPADPVTQEYRIRHKNNEYHWLEAIASNRLDHAGVQALVVNYRDITERKVAEAALKDSEQQYRRLVEHSPYAVIVHSQGLLVYVNQAGVNLIGAKTAEEIYGTHIINFIHPDSKQREISRIRDLQEGKEVPLVEEKFLRMDGRTLEVEVAAYPFSYQGKNAVQVVMRDITGQKSIQRAILASEERFSKAFHSSPLATCITTVSEGRFVDVNEAYVELSKWSREELIGHTGDEFGFYDSPVQRLEFLERTRRQSPESGWEDRFVTANGEVLETRAFYELIELGGESCVLSMFYDVTAQNRARETIRENEERIRAIIEHTQNIYYSHTPNHILTFMSGQTRGILGYEPEEALKDWHEYLTDHPVNQRGVELTQRAIDTGKQQEPYILELKAKDGHHVWVEVRESPVVRDGRTVAIVGALADISDRKEAQEKLERQLAELTVLQAVAMAGSQSNNEDDIIERTTQVVGGMLYPDNSGVMLLASDGTLKIHPSYQGIDLENTESRLALSKGITGRVATTGRPLLVNDVTAYRDYVEMTSGIRSELCVPIRVNQRIIGVLNVESRKKNAFHEEDERLLNTVAGTLGTAIERIRISEAERRRVTELTALYETSQSLQQVYSVQELAEETLRTLVRNIGYTYCAILFINEEHTHLVPFAISDWEPEPGEQGRKYNKALDVPLDLGITGYVARTGSKVRTGNVGENPRYLEIRSDIKSEMCVPIRSAGRVIGVINIESIHADAYTDNDEHILETIAGQLGIAIDKLTLFDAEKKRRQEAEKLHQAAATVSSSLNLKDVLNALLATLKQVVSYDSASILMPEGEAVRIVAAQGLPGMEQALNQTFPGSNALLQHIAGTGQPLILKDAQEDTRFENWAGSNYVRGWMGIPMIAHGTVLGYITLDSVKAGAYRETDAVLAQTFAHQAAAAIERAQLFENIQQAYDTTLEGWGNALELRDKETQGHTRRVMELTLRLARRLGLSAEDLVQIRRGVLVHDIGKMGVPDQILRKTGPLTKSEWQEMRKHPQYAYDLLYPIAYLRPALDIAYCHHEWWDGSGYPRGLVGTEIPLSARIFAVVDVWDALLSDRPYRKAWAKSKVKSHIQTESGTHFDPVIAKAFLKMLAEEDGSKKHQAA